LRLCIGRRPRAIGFAREDLRLSKLGLNTSELPKLDAEFEEITEGEELTKKKKLKTKWAALEALVGDLKRLALIAADLVAHFEKRTEAMDGKAMVVCMSRRICTALSLFLLPFVEAFFGAGDFDPFASEGAVLVELPLALFDFLELFGIFFSLGDHEGEAVAVFFFDDFFCPVAVLTSGGLAQGEEAAVVFDDEAAIF
jgi:hypothetical protein